MTRLLSPLHVAPHGLPLGDHRPSQLCPCRPVECVELLAGPQGRVVYVHRHVADPSDATEHPQGRVESLQRAASAGTASYPVLTVYGSRIEAIAP